MTKAIGIDLGTTYSCVGVWENERVEIIANDQGNRVTPSYVAFTENERIVGDPAKYQSARNYKNTIFDAKRLIGRRFMDPEVQADIKHWPFEVTCGKGGEAIIKVIYDNTIKTFTPVEISSMVLSKLKAVATTYLGEDVESAVISVPVHFNDAQRQATRDAGTIAGLDVLHIINEPTAAALAYGLEKHCDETRNVLIFDIGGGTSDISLLTIDGGVFEVKATAGDTHLGGGDFDSCLLKYALNVFKQKNGQDISQDERAVLRIRNACERAKRSLSGMMQTSIEVDGLHRGVDFALNISRAKFEDLCEHLLHRITDILNKVFEGSRIQRDKVDEVVLVGGSTRIPRIQKLVSDYFQGKKLNHSINPDEAVAYGASIRAAMLTGNTSTRTESIMLIDVNPLSLGIETRGGIMTSIIKRNTTIPVEKTETFTTCEDYQTEVTIKVFEGERSMTTDNHLLGNFRLDGIRSAPAGTPKIEVTFELDDNSILHVYAVDKTPGYLGKGSQITITKDKSRFTKDEIERLIAEAEEYQDDDKAAKDRAVAFNTLESSVYRLRRKLEEERGEGSFLSRAEKKKFKKIVRRTLEWLEQNPKASIGSIREKHQEVKYIGECLRITQWHL